MITPADVYKSGALAATLTRTSAGVVFRYLDGYVDAGRSAIASTLPLGAEPRVTPAGAVPPYFAGLLPEGRRLGALRRAVKTSADDELSLLVAVGADSIGDVQVTAAGQRPPADPTALTVEKAFDELRFADIAAADRPALAGVQDKASASMISVPVSRAHERYILKLNPPENPHLVENEAWFLGLAKRCGLTVAKNRVVRDRDGEPGLLVTRFDRIAHAGGTVALTGGPVALAVEDACQALDLWPADKYNTTAEDACRALMALTAAPLVAARDLLRQVTFAWLTGNGDVHAKNLAVLQQLDGERRVSPAYDLPSTLLYGDTTLALTMGGKDTLTAARLRAFAAELGLPATVTDKTLGDLLSRTRSLGEQLLAAELPFDRRVLDKAARQLANRHRSLSN